MSIGYVIYGVVRPGDGRCRPLADATDSDQDYDQAEESEVYTDGDEDDKLDFVIADN